MWRRKYNCWLTELVQDERRKELKISWWRDRRKRFSELWVKVSYPSKTAVIFVIVVIAILWILQWKLNKHLPFSNPGYNLAEMFSGMWQIHATIAGLVLPILVFIIQLTKDEEGSAKPSSEILIRETKIFPIILFGLISLVKIGVDIKWFFSNTSFVIDFFVLFVMIIVLAGYAYYKALSLMFDKKTLKIKGTQLLKEKVGASVDYSIDSRIGNNLFFKEIKKLGIEYELFKPTESNKYMVLNAEKPGRITDINLCRLEEFIRTLPWKFEKIGSVSPEMHLHSGSERASQMTQKGVDILHIFRDRIYESDLSLIILEKQAFEPLNKDELEKKLRNIFRIENI